MTNAPGESPERLVWVQAPTAALPRSTCQATSVIGACVLWDQIHVRPYRLQTPNENSRRDMQIGETVVLKSGSTQMTIECIRKDGRVMCVWFDRRQNLYRFAFQAAVLKPMPR